MVDINKIANEISQKQKYSTMSKDEVIKYATSLAKHYDFDDEEKLKREILINLDKIDGNLWRLREDFEYIDDKRLNSFIERIIQEDNVYALTIPINELREIAGIKDSTKEYFEYKDAFSKYNLPESNIVNVIKLSKKVKSRIMNNLEEDTFAKIVRNNYCELYEEIDSSNKVTSKEKEDFLKVINIKNYSPMCSPYEDDIEKDSFHINSIKDLQNINEIRANKLDELMDDKYSVYDIKREFCNRFMNIDPIVLENCLYCPENKEKLEALDELYLIKEIVNINVHNKKEMIDIYSRYMYGSKNIELPDDLITYGYMFSTPEELKEIKNSKIDYSKNKFYHEIYFCRECLLDSNQKKKDREAQLEIPIGVFRNNKQISYENVVKDSVYNRNMAYPKIDLRKEDIDPNWIKRDYLTLEAISSNVDIDNPKRFDKEIPMSKNYSHLYDSFMYKEYYDRKQKEIKEEELEDEMNEIFSTVGLNTDIVREAMLNSNPPQEDDPII